MKCRACNAELEYTFADIGVSPLSNSYLAADQLQAMEPHYPLKVLLCSECWLVQLPAVIRPEDIFSDYAYFSSFSETWLLHAEDYVEKMVQRFGFNENHNVIEIASNDGYLLQYFRQMGLDVLGVEPARNVAKAVANAAHKTGVAQRTKRQLGTVAGVIH